MCSEEIEIGLPKPEDRLSISPGLTLTPSHLFAIRITFLPLFLISEASATSSDVRFDLASITNKRTSALSIAFIEDNLVIREILSDEKSSIPAVSIRS